jgi:hypothetical protein
MSNNIGDRYSTALRDTEKWESVQTACISDALQIGNHGGKGQVIGIPIGEAVAALVVSNQRVHARERINPVSPHRAFADVTTNARREELVDPAL